jgi:arsenate reductase (glutaredoxin)
MSEHPRLIERPIFLHDGRAVIARPPERVYELLD